MGTLKGSPIPPAPGAAGQSPSAPHAIRSSKTDAFELLTRELGAGRVLQAPEALEVYARDESGLGPFPPD